MYGPWEYALENPSYLRMVCRLYKRMVEKKTGLACAFINSYDGSCMKCDRFCILPSDKSGIGCQDWEVASIDEFAFNANIQEEGHELAKGRDSES